MEQELFFSSDKTKVIIISPIAEMNESIDFANRIKYRYDNLLVIGNGFDLNLGLQTKYRDFANSWVFKRMYVKRMQEKRNNGNPQPSLIDFLYGKKYYEKWYDIEESLLEYVSRKPDGSFVNNVEEDLKDYEFVCNALVEYFAKILKSLSLKMINRMRELPAGQLLSSLYSSRNIVYTFNYTPIDKVLETINTQKVHGEIDIATIANGEINKSNIILGIETNDIDTIAPGYTFLLKSNNKAFRSLQIALDLSQAKNVIFFGHSLNQMDFGYFDGYFKMLAINTDRDRMLTIITKDDSSRITILDNIRKMGISVRDISAHTNVQFILTDKLDREKAESEKFDNLIGSLRG